MKPPVFTLFALLILSGTVTAQDQQLGARTKAMGGSYTAFEDDPVSIWLNPAGTATQATQFSIAYQTYTTYPVDQSSAQGGTLTQFSVEPETSLVSPVFIPSFAGVVFQLGDAENPMAIGICYARPYHLNYAMDRITLSGGQIKFSPENNVEQSFIRFRTSFAYDFRFREPTEPGFFSHIGLGVGLDVGYVDWEFSGTVANETGSATSVGFGLGLLAGIYDNTESFKLNLGLAYQSAIQYDFDIDPDVLPAFDMPQQFNAGLTFYLLSGTPLRITLDFQWINWSETAEDPLFPKYTSFEDAVNYSIGVEYRVAVSDTIFLYPRMGFRRFDAPWDDENRLPATGRFRLVLETDSEIFNIFTGGMGVSWTTEEGKVRQVDLAGDFGGDSYNVAMGYTHEF